MHSLIFHVEITFCLHVTNDNPVTTQSWQVSDSMRPVKYSFRVFLCLFVCLLIAREREGDGLQFFEIYPGCLRDGFRLKRLGGNRWLKARKLEYLFLAGPPGHAPLHADWALGSGLAIGAQTNAGGQCADAI